MASQTKSVDNLSSVEKRAQQFFKKLDKISDKREQDEEWMLKDGKDKLVSKYKRKPQITHLPETYEDVLRLEGCVEWPVLPNLSSSIDFDDTKTVRTPEYFLEILQEAAPLKLNYFDRIFEKINKMENKIQEIHTMLSVSDEVHKKDKKFKKEAKSEDNVFVTELIEDAAVPKIKVDIKNGEVETDIQCLEYVKSLEAGDKFNYSLYPKFQNGIPMDLPNQLQPSYILHKISKQQDFNPEFRKIWDKVFLSETSAAMLQDVFWWIYVDKFDLLRAGEKGPLFDRIADNFVALFISINKTVQKKIFKVFPDCFAQAVYLAYFESFLSLRTKFNDDFKQYLVYLIHEWITGLKPPPNTWMKWLLFMVPTQGNVQNSSLVESVLYAVKRKKAVKLNLGLDAIENLGQHVEDISREASKHSKMTSSQATITSKINSGSQTAECCASGMKFKLDNVSFNLRGLSPLVSHFLNIHHLNEKIHVEKFISRLQLTKSEVREIPYYKQLNSDLEKKQNLKKEYYRKCERTEREINDLTKKQKKYNLEIEKLKNENPGVC